MSWVNNAVLFCGMDYRERIEEVNAYLRILDPRRQQFTTNDDWYGGTKVMEGRVWGAAFNYVSFATVMEALQSANWEYPEDVILVWKGQEAYCWNVYRLGDEEIVITDGWN